MCWKREVDNHVKGIKKEEQKITTKEKKKNKQTKKGRRKGDVSCNYYTRILLPKKLVGC